MGVISDDVGPWWFVPGAVVRRAYTLPSCVDVCGNQHRSWFNAAHTEWVTVELSGHADATCCVDSTTLLRPTGIAYLGACGVNVIRVAAALDALLVRGCDICGCGRNEAINGVGCFVCRDVWGAAVGAAHSSVGGHHYVRAFSGRPCDHLYPSRADARNRGCHVAWVG